MWEWSSAGDMLMKRRNEKQLFTGQSANMHRENYQMALQQSGHSNRFTRVN
ncbi:hypothetical protein DPMN_094432 [Dreissena polymorpha]|uniref:Uncharacterized protein n=1 Tax=Dreissena polymorpha TaxID=45954 RepID=A0A9D4L4R3_DREPO|nr:hypothetical protein DPMN_094432 [Dreissena polymorpha]